MLRKLKMARKLLEMVGYEGWRHCRGVYNSFDVARQAIPVSSRVGFDNAESAQLYEQNLERTKSSDYAVMFWLKPLLEREQNIFDFGGNKGLAYYSFKKYLDIPPNTLWTVFDVPAVVERGREIAAMRGESTLRFTTDFIEASACGIFLTTGSLQFVREELSDLLKGLTSLPSHLFINRVPFSDLPTFFTVHNSGVSKSPYRIANRTDFVTSLERLGYARVDEWECSESYCYVTFHPRRTVRAFRGFYFQRKP